MIVRDGETQHHHGPIRIEIVQVFTTKKRYIRLSYRECECIKQRFDGCLLLGLQVLNKCTIFPFGTWKMKVSPSEGMVSDVTRSETSGKRQHENCVQYSTACMYGV